MKTKFLFLFFFLPFILKAQEVIISGEALYYTNFSIINSSIIGSAIKNKSNKTTSTLAKPADLHFVRSENTSKLIQRNFIEELTKNQPQLKSALEKNFANHTLRNQFDKLLSSYGYSSLNVADAMTAYLVISWQVVNRKDFNDKKGFDQVRKMVTNTLLKSSFLQHAKNEEKQALSENFGYQSMLALSSYQQLAPKLNQTPLKELQNAVDKNSKALGFDMKSLKLTAQGFVKK